jgi:hypothetical protein
MNLFYKIRKIKPVFLLLSCLLILSILLSACGDGTATIVPATTTNVSASATPVIAATTSNPQSTTGATGGITTTAATTAAGTTSGTAATTKVPIPYTTVAVSNDARQSLEKVADETSKVRDLSFKNKVDYNFLSPTEIANYFKKLIEQETTPDQIADLEKTFLAFGFTKPDFKYLETYLKLVEGNVAGFYDRVAKKFFVQIEPGQNVSLLSKFTAEHELTHALQDQHFSLEKLRPERKPTDKEGNDDQDLAVLSLFEGDASLSSLLWLQGPYLTQNDRNQFLKEAQKAAAEAGEVTRQVPPILLVSQTFPYEQGLAFVQKLYQQGGWEAVNKAWREYPPVSSSQILNFEKYQKRIKPVKVEFSDLTATLGSGWRSIDINTMGEYITRIWLKGQVGDAEAVKASTGWAGDRYQVLEKDGKAGFVWRSSWESENDAREFFDQSLAYIGPTYGAQGSGGSGDKRTWQTADKDIQLIRKGKEVLVVALPKGDAAAKSVTKLGF